MHRRLLALLALAFAVSACGGGPPINDAYAPFVAAHLRQANENWFGGLRTGSVGLLDALLAEDFTYHGPDGTTGTRASVLDAVRAGQLRYDSVTTEGSRTRIHERTAVVTGAATVHRQREGQLASERLVYTSVYAWNGERWQMLAWQGTRRAD